MSRIEEWREIRATMTCPEFAERYPWAFLVSVSQRGASDVAPGGKALEFRTVTHSTLGGGSPSVAPSAAGTNERLIIELKKLIDNPFPDRISIGRAPNCDVVIRDPSVSKLHGHFRDVRRDSAVFSDAKSSNGTRIDGNLIEPGAPVEVISHAVMVMGRVRLMLLSAAAVYDWL